MKPAAVNASPLIVLAGAGYFDLLPAILSPVVVPRAVLDEINAGPLGDPAIAAVAKAAWLSVVELNPVVSPIATWRLGRGETEVLEFARRNPGTVAVLDDKAARQDDKTSGGQRKEQGTSLHLGKFSLDSLA